MLRVARETEFASSRNGYLTMNTEFGIIHQQICMQSSPFVTSHKKFGHHGRTRVIQFCQERLCNLFTPSSPRISRCLEQTTLKYRRIDVCHKSQRLHRRPFMGWRRKDRLCRRHPATLRRRSQTLQRPRPYIPISQSAREERSNGDSAKVYAWSVQMRSYLHTEELLGKILINAGTCTLAIVMMNFWDDKQLPGNEDLYHAPRDITSWRDIWEAASQIEAVCLQHSGKQGWAAEGTSSSSFSYVDVEQCILRGHGTDTKQQVAEKPLVSSYGLPIHQQIN